MEDLATDSPQFSRPSVGVLKFHGVYQQDDRDLRKKSPTKVYSCMVRVGVPGGGLTAEQYIGLDRLADEAGDGTLRITSRQGVQYHYVGKTSLARLIRSINETGLNTWAACGDVVRNVTACSAPLAGGRRGGRDGAVGAVGGGGPEMTFIFFSHPIRRVTDHEPSTPPLPPA
ncbi:MAG TPA: hypothetical protein DCY80_03685, partial [Solibacterales bacterium]|nr:hypothetical protein [Bryobacterales bacterium]